MKKLIILAVCFLVFSEKSFSSIDILSISFDKNGSPWLDPIMDAVRTDLSSIDSMNFNFSTVYYNKNEKFINTQIALLKPKICFFPDYYLTKMFHSTCSQIGAKVAFVSNTRPEILDKNYSGVYIDFPANKPFDIIDKIKKLKSIGIIGGSWPGASSIAQDIKEKIGSKTNIVIYTTEKWSDYKAKVNEWEKNKDGIWILIPFGVYTESHLEVDHKEVATFISNIKIPTIGFGSVKGEIKRTFNIGPDPTKVGKYAAAMIYQLLKGDKPRLHMFSELEFIIDRHSLKKIGLDKSLPSGFEHFLR